MEKFTRSLEGQLIEYSMSLGYEKLSQRAINQANKLIKNKGRMLVRKSGTESKIRIMGESENKALLIKCVNIVKRSII